MQTNSENTSTEIRKTDQPTKHGDDDDFFLVTRHVIFDDSDDSHHDKKSSREMRRTNVDVKTHGVWWENTYARCRNEIFD